MRRATKHYPRPLTHPNTFPRIENEAGFLRIGIWGGMEGFGDLGEVWEGRMVGIGDVLNLVGL